MDIEKIQTGIDELDQILDGGVPKRHTVLITGTAGTMKSSLAFQTAYHSALKGMNCVYISLEQSANSILTQAALMGYDLAKISLDSNDSAVLKTFTDAGKKDAGILSIIDIGLIRDKMPASQQKSFGWLDEIRESLTKKSKQGAEIFVLDSLNALLNMETFENGRVELFHFFKFLRRLNLTSLIIKEKSIYDAGSVPFEVDMQYLSDGIIELSLAKRKLAIKRELTIVKMRYADHMTNAYVFTFNKKKAAFKLSEKIAVDD